IAPPRARISALKGTVTAGDTLPGRHAALASTIKASAALPGEITALEGRVTALDTLPGQVTALEGRITPLETLPGQVTALDGRVAALESRIQKLEKRILILRELSIGDSIAGGIIFDLDDRRLHGQMTSASDLAGVPTSAEEVTSFLDTFNAASNEQDWVLPTLGQLQTMFTVLHEGKAAEETTFGDFEYLCSEDGVLQGMNFSDGSPIPSLTFGENTRIRLIREF
ncbi:MAG: hypothetical protein J5I98_28200, partial [Phaeodactylibacter sp.]|nr:hypothetical protein [Phaeodactylibacter sp.]